MKAFVIVFLSIYSALVMLGAGKFLYKDKDLTGFTLTVVTALLHMVCIYCVSTLR